MDYMGLVEAVVDKIAAKEERRQAAFHRILEADKDFHKQVVEPQDNHRVVVDKMAVVGQFDRRAEELDRDLTELEHINIVVAVEFDLNKLEFEVQIVELFEGKQIVVFVYFDWVYYYSAGLEVEQSAWEISSEGGKSLYLKFEEWSQSEFEILELEPETEQAQEVMM